MAPNPIDAYQRSDPVIRGPDTSLRGLTQLQVVSTPGMIDYDHDDEACYGYYLMSLTVTWSFYSAHNDNPHTVQLPLVLNDLPDFNFDPDRFMNNAITFDLRCLATVFFR